MLPKIVGFISIVGLLIWMGYFVIGGSPLLILKHDTPVDARFIRGFFDVHYRVLMSISAVGALSFTLADRRFLAAAMACVTLIGFAARLVIVSRMDRIRSALTATDARAIKKFRRLHVAGIMLDVFYLVGFVWVLTLASLDLFSCVDIPPGCRDTLQSAGHTVECRHLCSLF